MAIEQLLVRLNMDAIRYNAQARTAAANTAAIGASAKTTATATGGLGAKMKGLATGGGGLLAVAGGAFAVKQAFDGTVGAFASFDDAMTESLAIMGDVSDEMREEMSDAAREVAKATTFSAEEAAEAYFFLASAGLDAAASVEAMPAVAQFAQAGMFDMATATDLATDAQSALGLASDDAATNLENLTRVTDVFVKANTLANTSVEQISEAMTSRAGAALRALNKDVEEGAAVLAALADQGVKGAEAGTQLGIVLRDLQTKALSNEDAFERAGIAVFNAEGNMRNIADILGDVEVRMDGMSDAQKRAELSALGFSDRSIAVLTTLLGTSDAIREYEDELRSAGGATEEVADKQLESAAKQWELFLSGLQDVGIELGENVLPALQDMLPALQDSAEGIGDMVEGLAPLVELLGLVSQGYNDVTTGAEELGRKGAASGDPILGVMSRLSEFATKPAVAVFFGLVADAVGESGDAAEEAAPGFSTLGGEMNQIPTAMEDIPGAMEDSEAAIHDLDPEMRALFGSASDVADAQEDVERETSNATRALDEQFNLIRSQLDPLFGLQQAAQRVAENQAEVTRLQNEGKTESKEYEEALLDLFEANVDLRGAQIDVVGSSDSTREAFIEQAIELGHTREEAERLAEEFAILQGFEFTPKEISITTRVSGPGSRTIGSFFGAADLLRHSGGPGRAGAPYRIRPNEEIFVPSGDGEFLLNNEVIDALRGLSSNSNTTTTNNYNIPVHAPSEQVGAQYVGAIASVLRRMETL